jgi:hypothetical protein
MEAFWGQRFFVTKGYIGLGPPPTTGGVMIALVDGSRYPFVVGQNGAKADGLLFIGTCFVNGLMFGEGLRNPDLRHWAG